MTHKQTFEAYVRERCPELMELSLGCRIEVESSGDKPEIHTIIESVSVSDGIYTTDWGAYIKPSREKIIGHPIQLHHVLRVLFERKKDIKGIDQQLIIKPDGTARYHCVDNVAMEASGGKIDLPLTPPSEWPEDVYQQLCKICDIT